MSDIPPALKHVIVWLLLATGLFLAVQAWLAEQRRARISVAGGVIELQRGPDGHFHWPGRVGGVAVDFLVDTGATRTALPQALARQAGLQSEGSTQAATAGGLAQGWVARADIVLEGGVQAQRLPVTVLPQLEAPLLGMDLLSRLRFSQQGGVLRIEATAR